MNLELSNCVALVAGSSRGIGRAIAARLLDEGARVVLTGRDSLSLSKTCDEFVAKYGDEKVLQVAGDLADISKVNNAIDVTLSRWGTLDCLVANIGTGRSQPGWEIGRDIWNAAFEANLWPSVQLVRAVLPIMTKAKSGSIVVIGSIAGLEATRAPLGYSAAKAALANYTKNIAAQVGALNVRINYVAPGNVLFPGGSWEQHLTQRRQEVESFINGEVALKRFGTPEEIADLVVFLASHRASFITGSILIADGGQTRSI